MSLDLANSNVNRNITLAGTSVAIFTFLLFFLYPRYSSGDIDPILFQFTLAIILSNLLTGSLSNVLLRYYSRTVSSTWRGNGHFWKGGSVLAYRLQPTTAGAEPNPLHSEEPLNRCAICTSPMVLILLPH